MLSNAEVYFKKPDELDSETFEAIYLLIAQGGEVNNSTLREHLLDTVIIGYITVNGKVVASAAVKKSEDDYYDNVFLKAHSRLKYEDFQFQMGYLMVAPAFRRRGFASLLVKNRCELFKSDNLYATVRLNNRAAQSILINNGFEQSGRPFKNRTATEDLVLFVKKANKSTLK
jgi:ribosomal protein S18 acetylase RimI-like enzyme